VAERFPGLVAKAAASGHEVGVHGFHHHQVLTLQRAQHREALCRAKAVIEKAGGVRAIGYRAMDFGVTHETWWVLDELLESGDPQFFRALILDSWMTEFGIS
jgi:peptidoglycan/xylan/chitin deacetylase (PgdA/CDA1 family)